MSKKAYVFIINKKGEIQLEKGKFIHPLIIKTKHRVVIKTVNPYIYNKKECYFVYDVEPHTYNPQTSEIIDKEIFEFAKQIATQNNLELSVAQELQLPEDLTPHQATEKIIGLIINESLTTAFLKSFIKLERQRLLMYLLMFLAGLFFGIGIYPLISGG